MRAHDLVSEVTMNTRTFQPALAAGQNLGVLVGFEFEVCMPETSFHSNTQSDEAFVKKLYDFDFFNNEYIDISLHPHSFDSIFKLKPGVESQYRTATEAYPGFAAQYEQKLLSAFNDIPEKIREKIVPRIRRRRSGEVSLKDKIEFLHDLARLGKEQLASGQIKISNRDRNNLRKKFDDLHRIQPSFGELLKFWLDIDRGNILTRFNQCFDYDPAGASYELELNDEADWPFDDEKVAYEETAKTLQPAVQAAMGRPVKIFRSYHQAKKNTTDWYIEPDSSIEPNDSDGAAEIVSPPLPVYEALQALQKFYELARQYKLYTNESTGLHINVSIPATLDILKLAVMLGDQHVLKTYGRQDSDYAYSVYNSIRRGLYSKDLTLSKPQRQEKELQKIVANAVKEHHASVNWTGRYISFRQVGGNYLANYGQVVASLGRFVLAMTIASDPNAYKREYQSRMAGLVRQSRSTGAIEKRDELINRLRAGNVPVMVLDIFKTTNIHIHRVVELAHGFVEGTRFYEAQQNSAPARARFVDRIQNPNLRKRAVEAPLSKFYRVILVPNSIDAMSNIQRWNRNVVDRVVNYDQYNEPTLAYSIAKPEILPANNPIVQQLIKSLLKQKYKTQG